MTGSALKEKYWKGGEVVALSPHSYFISLDTLLMNHLILYCRPGFESDLAAEITDFANTSGFAGYAKTDANSGFVVYQTFEDAGALRLIEELPFTELAFARQWFACDGLIEDLDPADRISRLLAALDGLPQAGEVVLETADTNEAKQLAGFCRKFTSPCAAALRKKGLLAAKRNRKQPRLHLFFLDSSTLYAGISYPQNSSADEMGIIRLKFPADAPSRSTLKLEEAWKWFLSRKEQEKLLQPAMTAVDLGAAPGGWTYQLVKKHIRVEAIDNGPMSEALMDSGIVKHIKADGFKYRPEKPVDWLVCDMVEKPSKVASLMASWVIKGDCRMAMFNLKLPMKKRYQAVSEARELIDERFQKAGVGYGLNIKQLYHDREEVTCFLYAVEDQ